ncbi:FAD/NAD(P)-binding domain-containing protein [Hypoxylon sp. FL0543]|nr:FAD/NAD(P)-binding domain-containing protein [Hypoxylon sp. FL0543]
MTKTVVILGAGVAGLQLAHYLVSRTAAKQPDLRVVLVSPNTHFYWGLASVRFVLPTQQHGITEDKYLIPIEEQFARYPNKAQFEFVAGAAKQLHPDRNSVTVARNAKAGGAAPEEVEIAYHTLIVATGTTYRGGMPWKALGTTEDTRAAVAQLRKQIDAAQTIVVAGAGATGVEFTGELAAAYGKGGKKKITLVSTDALPLEPRLQDRVRASARKELEKLGVKFLGNAKVTAVTPAPKGGDAKEIKVEVASGGKTTTQTLEADLLVPTYGAEFNTSFAPASMIAPSGRLRQNPDLRAPDHPNIFVVGDVGDLQHPQAIYAEQQAWHVMQQFSKYLATDGREIAPYHSGGEDKIQFAVTVGPSRAAGQMGGFQLPSLLIWWLKGRYLGTNYTQDFAAGNRGLSGALPK